MKISHHQYLILVVCCFLFSFTQANIPKNVWKKIEKSISKIWNEDVLETQGIELTEYTPDLIRLSGQESFYKIIDSNGQFRAYMAIGSAPSRYDNFELMVLYDADLSVIKSEVLVYREDYGGEIMSKRWLKQFIGKSAKDPIKLNEDIQGISGATISCRTATFEIKRLTNLLQELNEQGILSP
jgi:Na+-translocating ferredoxin:NAD+ oxidoreductase RnfG subunit